MTRRKMKETVEFEVRLSTFNLTNGEVGILAHLFEGAKR